jgi:WD40 repeat protein
MCTLVFFAISLASGGELSPLRERVRLAGHNGSTIWVEFSPTGKLVATSGLDKSIKIWDLSNGKMLRQEKFSDRIGSFSFLQSDDELIVSSEKGAFLWDARSGKVVQRYAVAGLFAVSPDKKSLCGLDAKGSLLILEVQSGKELAKLSKNESSTRSVVYCSDGSLIATSNGDGTIKLWSTATMKCMGELTGHHGSVYGMAFSRDGKRIATAGDDGTIRLWDTANSAELAKLVMKDTSYTALALCESEGILLAVGAVSSKKIEEYAGTLVVIGWRDFKVLEKKQGRFSFYPDVTASKDCKRVAVIDGSVEVIVFDLLPKR